MLAEVAGHLQSGSSDSQGADHSLFNVSQLAGKDPCTTRALCSFDAPRWLFLA